MTGETFKVGEIIELCWTYKEDQADPLASVAYLYKARPTGMPLPGDGAPTHAITINTFGCIIHFDEVRSVYTVLFGEKTVHVDNRYHSLKFERVTNHDN
jgi:hypothetical protein